MARAKDTTGAAVLPMGDREPDSKSALTRRRILDAAAQVLSVKGYGGLRLTDVAAVAEIQAPAICYYFPGREDLIEEVMWAGIAEMREHVLGVLDALPAKSVPARPTAGRRRGPPAPRVGDLGLHNGFHPQFRTGAAGDTKAPSAGGGALRRGLAQAGQ